MPDPREYSRHLPEGSPPEGPSEVTTTESRPARPENGHGVPSPSDDGGGFLKSFLNAHPFTDLFEHWADRHFSGKTQQIKNAKLKTVHPHFFNFCCVADLLVRSVVVIMLIGASGWALWKVVR